MYLSHINDSEEIYNIKRVVDKLEIVLKRHILQYTDFLNPYQRELAYSILNRFEEVSYKELGGVDKGERKIILIYPSYFSSDDLINPLDALKISGDLSELTHKDFLGSILGLGIDRGKVGDIFIHDGYTQVVVLNEISKYIFYNLNKIGKTNVDVDFIPYDELESGKDIFKRRNITVSSLRLDVVISGVLNLSRNKSLKIIQNKKVKVNWKPIYKSHYELNKGDIISVRGYGRFILDNILGISKKGKVKMYIKVYE